MIEFSTRTAESGVAIIEPKGRLNMVAAPRLRELIESTVEAGATRIVIDLSATDFIDSSGLGALISGLKCTRQAGGDLRIAQPNAQIETVLSLTNLNRVLKAYASAEGAFSAQ
ncbi:STAS domain-containing protein [Hoyosella subflava]|uniref:Anti-sigma factor antagonist n=1 Tax=Hoyosella subflava (strain DSM 45089 / JCM 17490 / NBRC 109087 / DQS3-9A1) TaxID=443218 RepID=F6EET5_HOYSD|nr:STAS domain-containing protein [Hoyosella subflava]AEF40885.1 Anti-sigma factor antagonist [Hoyosella subflava DQS3-9A1]